MAQSAPIEVDPELLENNNSDYASSGYNTSTDSLTSSVYQYVFENGRRYHAYYGVDKTVMPNDEEEQSRLDLHHEIFLTMMGGKLHLAPIDPTPQKILDVGTGTGIWAIDMADMYPSAEVLGTDLSPIQPKWVPPNCRFEVDDAEEEWVYADESFDFIHIRNLAQAFTDWDKVMAQVWRCIKPGGWVELAELGCECLCDDGSMHPEINRYFSKLAEACAKLGRPFPTGPESLTDRLNKAGFRKVASETYKQPSGPWPKDKKLNNIGLMTLLGSDTGYHAYGMAVFTRILHMGKEEADELCKGALKSAKSAKNHTYSLFFVAYGQKPEAEGETNEDGQK
ncbi:S-adenosyl-L-methionine-dependent methyltransferase [Kalaharituber pfeilii]|nr:S-adenosyl-L-methionine-dependent methyltransferase [Kalaharituber pfeilii]